MTVFPGEVPEWFNGAVSPAEGWSLPDGWQAGASGGKTVVILYG
ncbi:MAG TPA: hypothetical protein VF369_02400 [candidate division Zixibacteria bacterium]